MGQLNTICVFAFYKYVEMASAEIARRMPHDRDWNVEKSVRPAKSTFARPRQRIGWRRWCEKFACC